MVEVGVGVGVGVEVGVVVEVVVEVEVEVGVVVGVEVVVEVEVGVGVGVGVGVVVEVGVGVGVGVGVVVVIFTLESFDLRLVQQAVRNEALPEHEYAGVEERLRTAIRVWLPSDVQTYETCLQEEEFQVQGGHGFLDLVLVRPDLRCIVPDWKTTEGWDAPGWVLKKKLDAQTSWYLGYGAEHLREKYGYITEYIEYRCITADGEFKTLQVGVSELHGRRVREQNEVLQKTFLAMRDITGPWLQRMPDACFLGSKSGQPTCPFFRDCTTGSEPRLVQGLGKKVLDWVPLSKSAYKMYQKCPEQYRRTRLLGDTTEDMGLAARIGISFHHGVAEVWRQAFALKEKGRKSEINRTSN